MLYYAFPSGVQFPGIMAKKILQSIGAVIAGAVISILLQVGTDSAMRVDGNFSQGCGVDERCAIRAGHRVSHDLRRAGRVHHRAAGAQPADDACTDTRRAGHGCLGRGAVAMWDRMPEIGPRWYALVLIVLALPSAWLGGKLRLMQLPGEARG